jgi:hypothetical protein
MSIFLFENLLIISYDWSESAGYGLFEIVGYPIYECSSSFGKTSGKLMRAFAKTAEPVWEMCGR